MSLLISFLLLVIGIIAEKLLNKNTRIKIVGIVNKDLDLSEIQQHKLTKRFKLYYIFGNIALFSGLLILFIRII
jgi:hypothetical protein